jgi:hypothetical protein
VSLFLCLFPSVSLKYLLKGHPQHPCFPPAERLWALKPDFHCGGRKKREFALFFFRARRFRFVRALFSSRFHALFWLRARERESAKKALAPTYGIYTQDVSRDFASGFFSREPIGRPD